MKLLVKGIGQLVTVTEGQRFLAGADMANITLREGSLALAVDNEGKIAMIGREDEVVNTYTEKIFSRVIDAEGAAVLPGLVDGHTHPVWAGDRHGSIFFPPKYSKICLVSGPKLSIF